MMIKENVMNFVKAQFLPFKVYNLFTNDFWNLFIDKIVMELV